jgi:UDP-N-acetylmuramate dehydrogenase
MLLLPFDKQITDPKELGNSGSFLINTFKTDFEKHQQFPEMKYYDVSETEKSLRDG